MIVLSFFKSGRGVYLLAVLPFLMLWKGADVPRITWILCIAVGLVAFLVALSKERIEMPRNFVVLLTGALVLSWASFVFSTTRDWGFDFVVRDTALMIVALLISAHRDKGYRLILRCSIAAVFLSCLFGLLVYVLQAEDRFVGTFLDWSAPNEYWSNAMASVLLLTWPLVSLTFSRRGIRILLAGFFLGCLLLTASRGAYIAFGAQVSILLLLGMRSRVSWKKQVITFSLMAFVALLIAGGVNSIRQRTFPVLSVPQRVMFTSSDGTSSLTERFHYWQQALVLTGERPLLGWGPNSFAAAHEQFQTVAAETSSHAHQFFLNLSAERGILMSLIMLAIFLQTLWICFSFSRKNKDTMSLVMGTSLAGVFLHNMVDATLLIGGVAICAWMLIGLVFSKSAEKKYIVPRSLFSLLAVAVCFLSFQELIKPTFFKGDEDIAKAMEYLNVESAEDKARARKLLIALQKRNPADARIAFLMGIFFVHENDLEKGLNEFKQSYVKGAWNSPNIVLSFLETSRALDQTDILQNEQTKVHALVTSMAEAVRNNRHMVTRSAFADDLISLLQLLPSVYPEDRDYWNQLEHDALKNIEHWRNYFRSRPQDKFFQT